MKFDVYDEEFYFNFARLFYARDLRGNIIVKDKGMKLYNIKTFLNG